DTWAGIGERAECGAGGSGSDYHKQRRAADHSTDTDHAVHDAGEPVQLAADPEPAMATALLVALDAFISPRLPSSDRTLRGRGEGKANHVAKAVMGIPAGSVFQVGYTNLRNAPTRKLLAFFHTSPPCVPP